MGTEMDAIQKLQLGEDSRLRDVGAQLYLEEAQGAQMAAQNAQREAAQATAQGFSSVESGLQQGLSQLALYPEGLGRKEIKATKVVPIIDPTTSNKRANPYLSPKPQLDPFNPWDTYNNFERTS